MHAVIRFVGICLAAVILIGTSRAADLGSVTDVTTKGAVGWKFLPGFNGGYHNLIDGYDDYDNLGNAGFDLYIQSPRDTPLPTRWYDNFLFRLSADYFPLQVPEATLGLDEDIFSWNVSAVYRFINLKRGTPQKWVPFLGVGGGLYYDRVELDTPASGKITKTSTNEGWVLSAGFMIPKFKLLIPIRLVPEVRYHAIKSPGGSATSITYQLGAVLWTGGY